MQLTRRGSSRSAPSTRCAAKPPKSLLEAPAWPATSAPPRAAPAANPVPYPQDELTYLGNVFNAKGPRLYEKHGVKLIEEAYEAGNEKAWCR